MNSTLTSSKVTRTEFICTKNIDSSRELINLKSSNECISFAYGHTTLNTPVLVRSLKLSNVGLG